MSGSTISCIWTFVAKQNVRSGLGLMQILIPARVSAKLFVRNDHALHSPVSSLHFIRFLRS